MRYGYARTSTNKQHTDRQINELQGQCDEIFVEDGVSAKKKNRPVFHALLKDVQQGDEIVVLSYDRAFRSVIEGLVSLDELSRREVKLVSLMQNFDPTAPDGRLFFTIILALAEWEIGILSSRTIQGLRAAVKRGSILGRPRKGETRSSRKEKQYA